MDKRRNIEFAVKAIIMEDKKFLALHRRDAAGSWHDLPGGRMEYGETAEEAVIREVKEETGLIVEPVRILDSWNNVREDFQITGIFYLCTTFAFDIILSDEHDQYKWFDADKGSAKYMHPVFGMRMERWDWDKLQL